MKRPAVALLTDFGTSDPYVSIMKGVIRERVDCDLIDLTHEIARGHIWDGAFFLSWTSRYLRNESSRTVVCAVIDPGVGTDRRVVAIRSSGLWLVGPDNGLFSLVVTDGDAVHEVTRDDLFLPESSMTFHGRDRFAPVAAAIAAGFEVEGLGPPVSRADLVRLEYEPPRYDERSAVGTLISIDHFGNMITDLHPSRIEFARPWIAEIGDWKIANWAKTYAKAEHLDTYMIEGSRGTIEFSVSNGSAATLLQPEPRANVTIRPKPSDK